MIRINLLPHREIKHQQQQHGFYGMLVAVVGLGAAAWFAGHIYLSGVIDDQKGRNAYLEAEIVKLDKQIAEIKVIKEQIAVLLQRKQVVESLQSNRSETVHLLDQLVRLLPDGVYLKSIQQKNDKVDIGGYAQSNSRVSTFMRNLESSPNLEKPSLIEIRAAMVKNARISEFNLSVLLTRAKDTPATAKKPAAKPTAGAKVAAPPASVTIPAQSPKK